MKEGFKELALMYKDSSVQIITDFDKSIRDSNNDNQNSLKKFNQIEKFVKETHDELF